MNPSREEGLFALALENPPAQTAEWKQKLAAFQQASEAAGKKPE